MGLNPRSVVVIKDKKEGWNDLKKETVFYLPLSTKEIKIIIISICMYLVVELIL